MAGYLCLEINNEGFILSKKTPDNYALEHLIPINAVNLLNCWDEETNLEFKHQLEVVFNSAFPIDFSIKIKENNLKLVGHRLSDERAFIYIKPPKENKILSENEWGELIDFSYRNAEECIFFVRDDASFFEFNERAISLHGYSKEELHTMTVFDLNPFFTKEMWHAGWANLEEIGTSVIETKHRKKNGTLIDVVVNNKLIQYGGNKLLCAYITDITTKKMIEERLHLVDFAFKKSAVSIFITKEDSSFYEFNEAALGLYGYTKEEMEKLTVADLTVAFKREKVPEAWANLWVRMKEQNTIVFQSKHQKKDGTIMDVEIRVNYINYNGLELNCAFIIDITDAKKTEEALRKSIQRYEYATNAASDVIWEADFAENTYYLTQNYTTYFGHPSGIYENLYQNEWIKNIHPEDIEHVMQASNNAIHSDNKVWMSEYRLKKANGEYATIKDKGFVVRDEQGNVLKLVGSLNDITLKKEAEQEREKLLKELMTTNNELKKFSYITTHNLRAPLTNLISICSILNTESITDARTLKLIEGFKTSTLNLNDTLNDLISILIIKENTNLIIENNSIKSVFNKVLLSINTFFEDKGALIETDFSEAETVMFNAAYLESVFLNLITNSLKYAQPNKIPIIKVKTRRNEDGAVVLTFSDNGIGMNMKVVKDKIFGLYQRFHSNTDSKGIGLYLIHSEITSMGGTIEVDSEVNVGTTFTITFKA